jgi:hypothetical protein
MFKKDMELRSKSHPQILAISSERSASLQHGTGNETWKIKTTSEQLRCLKEMTRLLAVKTYYIAT